MHTCSQHCMHWGGDWLAGEMVLEALGTLEAAGREWGAWHTSTQPVPTTSW